jgi:hypothetical protein
VGLFNHTCICILAFIRNRLQKDQTFECVEEGNKHTYTPGVWDYAPTHVLFITFLNTLKMLDPFEVPHW